MLASLPLWVMCQGREKPDAQRGCAPEEAPVSALFLFIEGAWEQTCMRRRNIFCVGVSWERQPPSTWEHWLILPQGEKQPLFPIHCQATGGSPWGHWLNSPAYVLAVPLLLVFLSRLYWQSTLPVSPSAKRCLPSQQASFPSGSRRKFKEGLTEKVTFEQKPEGSEGWGEWGWVKRVFQAFS